MILAPVTAAVVAMALTQFHIAVSFHVPKLQNHWEAADLLTGTGKSFPALINVTLEDLQRGLETGLFTSVDLVNVRPILMPRSEGY